MHILLCSIQTTKLREEIKNKQRKLPSLKKAKNSKGHNLKKQRDYLKPVLQNPAKLGGANPPVGPVEVRCTRANIHQQLLNFADCGNRLHGVALENVPAADGLQRAVRTAPPLPCQRGVL
jgi:hypothetical protein